MNGLATRYDRWKAPAQDGQTLIWPAPVDLLRQTHENNRLLQTAYAVRLQNVPLPEVRAALRRWIGQDDDAQPIVATGHQAELHHPGVWVKNALINAAATKAGGRAVHFAVDTDEPKHLSLRWPGGSAPMVEELSAEWSGGLAPPSPAHLRHVEEVFQQAAARWSFKPMAPAFLASMRRLSLESVTLPAALTNSLHELDWSLGLRHDALLTSPLCLSEPFLLFVHHLLARAEAFATDYNAALDAFRQQNKIRAPGRPMPNLKADGGRFEVPFWLDDLRTGRRERAGVVRDGADFALEIASGERFVLKQSADGWAAARELMLWLRRCGVRLAPRALTLTAVLRLLAADQFVHGIGGGQYDQVLDRLIVRHFGLEPPMFSVTTATLYFPEAAGQPRVCLPCLAQDGHRLRHSLLGNEKIRMVEAIAGEQRGSPRRALLFAEMRRKLAAAAESAPVLAKWEREISEARQRAAEERVLFDRELFYAIQPADRLSGMIERYRDAFSDA